MVEKTVSISTDSTELKVMQCGTCGVWHAFPQQVYDTYRKEGGYWFCPNGHQRGWDKQPDPVKQENERLKRELDAEKKRKEWAEQEARNAVAREMEAKAKAKRLGKRIANGVCPCCTRSFINLRRHIATKHPEYPKKGAV